MKVELVGRTEGVGKYAKLTSEEIIAAIARHGVIKEDNGKLVKYLMDSEHWSPLDMINFVFEIETSRAMGRHLLRHNIKPQEHSQRYSDKVSFEPVELRKEHPTNRQSSVEVFDPEIGFGCGSVNASDLIEAHLLHLEELYRILLNAGVAKECARMILPECTTTVMTFNGTLRDWLSVLNVRCDHHAQKEIQDVALLIGAALEAELPGVFERIDWENGMFM
jgi:thymidylate synthase (FAD)